MCSSHFVYSSCFQEISKSVVIFSPSKFSFPKLSLVIVNKNKTKKPTKHNSRSCPSDNAWSTHLCPEESHFKSHLCRGSFSPAEKPRSHPRAFPEVMREGEWDQSSGTASHSPGRVPSCTLSSEPTFHSHQKTKKKGKILPKHSLYLSPKRTKLTVFLRWHWILEVFQTLLLGWYTHGS